MIPTQLAVVAVAGFLTGATPAPGWTTDYRQALSRAAAEQKPVAVFIGDADRATAGLTDAVRAKLAAEFVCVKADTTTDAGRQLAAAFQMTEGVVLSDRGGSTQVVRQTGPVAPAVVEQFVVADAPKSAPAASLTTAMDPVTFAPAYNHFASCAGGSCGGYAAPIAYGTVGGCHTGHCGGFVAQGCHTPYYGGCHTSHSGGCYAYADCGSSCGGHSKGCGGRGGRGGRGCR